MRRRRRSRSSLSPRIQGADDMRYSIYDMLIEIGLIFIIVFTPLANAAVRPFPTAIFEVVACLMFLFWIFRRHQ